MATAQATEGPLLGRDEELALLIEELKAVVAGRLPRLAVMTGPVGSGRTRLLRELAKRADGHELYPVVILAPDPSEASFARGLQQAIGPHNDVSPEGTDEDQLETLLGRVGEDRPVLLMVDDSGAASPRTLRQLERALLAPGRSLLVVLSSTSRDALERFELLGIPTRELDLAPLGAEAYSALVQALLIPVEASERHRVASKLDGGVGGYPGRVVRGLEHLVERGALVPRADAKWSVLTERLDATPLPVSLSDRAATRFASLSRDEQLYLEAAAIVGVSFWHGAVQAGLAVCGRGGRALASDSRSALDQLLRRGLLLRTPARNPGDPECSFVEGLDHDHALSRSGPAAQRVMHRAAATWLERAGAPHTVALALVRGHHHELGGDPRRAGLAYLEAADAAWERHSLPAAEAAYRQGLALVGDGNAEVKQAALHHHGDVLAQMGHASRALGAFREMSAIAGRQGQSSRVAAAECRIGRVHRETGNFTAAEACFEEGLARYIATNDLPGIASTRDDLGQTLCVRGDYGEALLHLEAALRIRRELGDRRSLALSYHNVGCLCREQGRDSEARTALDAALTLRLAIDDRDGATRTLLELGRLAASRLDPEGALGFLEHALDMARSGEQASLVPRILAHLGEALLLAGDAERALEVATDAATGAERVGDRTAMIEAHRTLARAHLARQELDAATTEIRAAAQSCKRLGSRPETARVLRTLGQVAAAGGFAGHHTSAVPYLMRSIGHFQEMGCELDVAKGLHAIATYAASAHYQSNAAIQLKAREVEALAQGIFVHHGSKPQALEAAG